MVSDRETVHDSRCGLMFPRIERAVAAILANGKVVAPVDALLKMDVLAPGDLEDWRSGRVPYLERAIRGSLSRKSLLLRILGCHCHDLNLIPSHTATLGPRRVPAHRLHGAGEKRLEQIPARHFVWPGSGPPPEGSPARAGHE